MHQATAKKITPILFILPFFILFLFFMLYPILESFYLSFTASEGSTSAWIGLENYWRLFTDELYWKSMFNIVVILLVQVPVMLFLAFLLAVAVNNENIKGRSIFRLAIFMPVLIDLVTYSIVFSILFNDQYGFFNYVLQLLYLPGIHWTQDTFWAKVTIIIAITWRWTGYNAIILLAGLQSIPNSIYEAADIDGATAFTKFFRITMPMLKPIFLFCAIMSVIGTLQLFTEPFLLTNGGQPDNSTETPVLFIYQYAFQSFHFGYASAAAYVLTAIIAIFSYLQIRISKGGEL
ncbi:putative membrane protein [Propionispora sp. 2/2-37]|uniref:carbohydrate ABC transporter permease n=1 Tax=Propionispora sp. 2/2-37 TaxID=1677858 RepID=UPI0006C1FFC4|nr:sugar ABC transporter permease [Propionispora sp. 2/2-37]CUH94747.1 putative membrane protein [Propionispora sp. 2/2-37]